MPSGIYKGNKGKHLSEETKKKISENNARPFLGKHHTNEAKKKMSKAGIGRKSPHSEKTKKKMSEIAKKNGIGKWMKGRKHTEEWKEKMSNLMKGRKVPREIVEKVRKSRKGYKTSEATKKKMSESQKRIGNKPPLHLGKDCHLWKGGITDYPYPVDWTITLRISIRERDKYICQICGKKQGDRVHSVHHIDYNKENCNPNNLITLCTSCHAKTNLKRDYWIKFFNLKSTEV